VVVVVVLPPSEAVAPAVAVDVESCNDATDPDGDAVALRRFYIPFLPRDRCS